MGINVFHKAKSASNFMGKVSTISKDLVKGGQIANKVLNNPVVEGLAVAGGPDTMALYAGARLGAKGAVDVGKGIQRAKSTANSMSYE